MTCDEFRERVKIDPWEQTKAEAGAVMIHYVTCQECRDGLDRFAAELERLGLKDDTDREKCRKFVIDVLNDPEAIPRPK